MSSGKKNFLPDFCNKQFGLPWVITLFFNHIKQQVAKNQTKPKRNQMGRLITGNSVGLYGNRVYLNTCFTLNGPTRDFTPVPLCNSDNISCTPFWCSVFSCVLMQLWAVYAHYTYACMCVQKHKSGVSSLFWALSSLFISFWILRRPIPASLGA